MPLPSSAVGATTPTVEHTVDARWTMAYAAGIDDRNPRYLDTTRADGVVAHPLFPVCLEWPVVLAARDLVPRDVLPRDELVRGVHATHDLQVHRLVQPGDELRTTGVVEGVEARRPGAYQVLRLDTVDRAGAPVCTTRMGSLFLGVEVAGADRPAPVPLPVVPPGLAASDADGSTGRTVRRHPISPTAAHVYTECARIWNPIHTDPAVARAAGLPGIILHGTATLALGVSAVVDEHADGDPARVRRVSARFGAMVTMPAVVETRVTGRVPTTGGTHEVWFEVVTADGEAAVRSGRVEIADG